MTLHRANVTITRPNYLGSGQWKLSKLSDITVLMGKNGSGKSLLLRAWRDAQPDTAHYVVPERTGEIDFQPNYMTEEYDGAKRKGVANRNFVQEYRRRIIGRVQTYLMIRGNSRGSAAPPADPSELEALLTLLVPDFSVRLLAQNPPYELLRLSGGKIQRIDELSSGEAQLFTMGLDILTIAGMWEVEKRAERTLLLDEPDSHIHPDLQVRLADFLVRVMDRFSLQLAVATHSTSLMAALAQLGRSKTSVIYAERTQTDYSAKLCDDVTVEMASCLGGHLLMGPLFGAPLLLVEGDDDYRIWSQVPRHHVIKLAVLPCNGDEISRYRFTLEKILGSLCDPGSGPLGYALIDGDQPCPTPAPSNPQTFVRFVRLNCHEAENLYLTDEVLALLGHTWESAKAAIVAAAPNYGLKQAALAAAGTWNRATQDLKTIINEVAAILDPKNLPWTVRVGTTIGREKPKGQLADFLGPTLLAALWPSAPSAAQEAQAATA